MPAQTIPSSLKNKESLNETLMSWKSPSHPFKKRNRIFYQTVAALTMLLIIIVFFLREFMLIGVILSIAFVVYVISTIPPIEVEHRITPLGFDNAGHLFRWGELYAFWFDIKWHQEILVLQTRLPFPGQIRAVITGLDKNKVKDVLDKYLLFFEKPQKTWSDNLSDWLAKKFPMETTG